MSRLVDAVGRLIGSDPRAETMRRLVRERPEPTRQFGDRLRAQLEPRWAAAMRPPWLLLRVGALIAAGLVLLAVAAIIAGS